jgi:ABC-2 type transport system ATP-binding protein
LTLRFEAPLPQAPTLRGALSIAGAGREWTVICDGARSELTAAATSLGARIVAEHTPSLDEIFVARVGKKTSMAAL